ncbi:MAG: NADH-quinone oxidoreductase subunit J [bacterium ADurb.Bin478]|nr:MAG: NADH-quinone oxidoreductase subunit J [bacterium ADurb.Bin478]
MDPVGLSAFEGINMSWFFFILFAALAVGSAIAMISRKNPVYSAVFLIITFFAVAGCYYLLQAPFLSIVQIIVYAGAIMVLFLFVIMLLNLRDEIRLPLHGPYQVAFAALFAAILLLQLVLFIVAAVPTFHSSAGQEAVLGEVEPLGLLLFTKYSYPFEIASLVLLVAIIGAVVLGRKKLPKEF